MRACVLLLLTACRSDDEVEGRARALLEAARRAKAPEAPTEPVSLSAADAERGAKHCAFGAVIMLLLLFVTPLFRENSSTRHVTFEIRQ